MNFPILEREPNREAQRKGADENLKESRQRKRVPLLALSLGIQGPINPLITIRGTRKSSVFPIPSWPEAFDPQQ